MEQLSDESIGNLLDLDSYYTYPCSDGSSKITVDCRLVARKAEENIKRQIGLNCYLVWAEVDGEYKENICISKDFL